MFKFTQGEPSEQQIAVLLVALTLLVTFVFLLLTATISGWLGHKAACARETHAAPKPLGAVPATVPAAEVTVKRAGGKIAAAERVSITESVV